MLSHIFPISDNRSLQLEATQCMQPKRISLGKPETWEHSDSSSSLMSRTIQQQLRLILTPRNFSTILASVGSTQHFFFMTDFISNTCFKSRGKNIYLSKSKQLSTHQHSSGTLLTPQIIFKQRHYANLPIKTSAYFCKRAPFKKHNHLSPTTFNILNYSLK